MVSASQNWYRESHPRATKKLFVHPRSALNRQAPREAATRATGVKTKPDTEIKPDNEAEAKNAAGGPSEPNRRFV